MVFIVVRHSESDLDLYFPPRLVTGSRQIRLEKEEIRQYKKETLFNANCIVATLLDSIKMKCGIEKSISIDLCDDKGCMCHLEDHLKENGSKYVKEREKYVLVKKEKTDGKGMKYSCLLRGLQYSDPELLGMIEGGATESEQTSTPTPHNERRRSSKVPDNKKMSISMTAMKKKSRATNKLY